MNVMCPKCGKLIDADKDKEVVFCSECGNNFTLEQGKKIFDRQFGSLAKAAFINLTQKGDYDQAIELYNACLDIVPNDLASVIGIALATLYKQDFLNLNFDKIIPIIDKYDIFLNEENTFLFLSFVEDVLKETYKYLREANERLFVDGKCLSKVYLANYEKSLDDILSLIAYFKDGIAICSEEEKKIFFEDNNLSIKLDNLEKRVEELKSVHHEVLEKEETLEDNRIIVVNKKALKTYHIAMGYEAVMAGLLILFLILGAALNNSIFYYLMLIPIVFGVGGYLIYYFFFLNKKTND